MRSHWPGFELGPCRIGQEFNSVEKLAWKLRVNSRISNGSRNWCLPTGHSWINCAPRPMNPHLLSWRFAWRLNGGALLPRKTCAWRWLKNAAPGWNAGCEGFFRLGPHQDRVGGLPPDGRLGVRRKPSILGSLLHPNYQSMSPASREPALPPSNPAGKPGANRGFVSQRSTQGFYISHVALRFDPGFADASGLAAERRAF